MSAVINNVLKGGVHRANISLEQHYKHLLIHKGIMSAVIKTVHKGSVYRGNISL